MGKTETRCKNMELKKKTRNLESDEHIELLFIHFTNTEILK